MVTGKCPKCGEVIVNFKAEAVTVMEGYHQTRVRATSYMCPRCSTILAVTPEVHDIVAEIADAVVARLKK